MPDQAEFSIVPRKICAARRPRKARVPVSVGGMHYDKESIYDVKKFVSHGSPKACYAEGALARPAIDES